MGERGNISGGTMLVRQSVNSIDTDTPGRAARMIPDIPVIDPWSGQNFQEYGPHTAYLRWLMQQPGDLARYRPSDFHPLIAAVRHASFRAGNHRTSARRHGDTRHECRQIDALELGLCCGWRALDQIQARWLHAWVGSVVACAKNGAAASWAGSRAERALARYCNQDVVLRHGEAVETALRRISAAGMTAVYEQACRFESWRDVEMLLMSAWQSGISLVDDEGYLLRGWKPRFALAFSMRFPEIS